VPTPLTDSTDLIEDWKVRHATTLAVEEMQTSWAPVEFGAPPLGTPEDIERRERDAREPGKVLPTLKAFPSAFGRQADTFGAGFVRGVPRAGRALQQVAHAAVGGAGSELASFLRETPAGDIAPQMTSDLEDYFNAVWEAKSMGPGKLEQALQGVIEHGLEGLPPTVRMFAESIGLPAAETLFTLGVMGGAGIALPPGQAGIPAAGGLLPQAGGAVAAAQEAIGWNAVRFAAAKALTTPTPEGEDILNDRLKTFLVTGVYMGTPAVSGLIKSPIGAIFTDVGMNNIVTLTLRAVTPGIRRKWYKDPDLAFSLIMDTLMGLGTKPLGPRTQDQRPR